MTLILAHRNDKGAYLACDSVAWNNMQASTVADSKIFSLGPGFLFGFCGSFRFGQLLQHSFSLPVRSTKIDDISYLYRVVNSLESFLKDYSFDIKKSYGSGILAHKGNLYTLQSDFSLIRHKENILADGSGWALGLGALQVELNHRSKPKKALINSMRAASRLTHTVKPPFYFYHQKPDGSYKTETFEE